VSHLVIHLASIVPMIPLTTKSEVRLARAAAGRNHHHVLTVNLKLVHSRKASIHFEELLGCVIPDKTLPCYMRGGSDGVRLDSGRTCGRLASLQRWRILHGA
jgi:hypothetical protein